MAMPVGLLNVAALPLPSVLPAAPAVPAKVVTSPASVILRIVWLPESVTNRLPAMSTTAPVGEENRAYGAPMTTVSPDTATEKPNLSPAPVLEALR